MGVTVERGQPPSILASEGGKLTIPELAVCVVVEGWVVWKNGPPSDGDETVGIVRLQTVTIAIALSLQGR
jgi:hypothetical protein